MKNHQEDEIDGPGIDDPSVDEIRERCLVIRKKWSQRETQKRAGAYCPEPYSVPVCTPIFEE